MPRAKAPPKYDWFCRCSKIQNRRAAAVPHPKCKACGRDMETEDDLLIEVKATPAPAPTATSPTSQQPSAAWLSRLLEHHRLLEDLGARVAKVENRLKAPSTVFADLEIAMPQMNREDLQRLADMLTAHLGHLRRALERATEILAN